MYFNDCIQFVRKCVVTVFFVHVPSASTAFYKLEGTAELK